MELYVGPLSETVSKFRVRAFFKGLERGAVIELRKMVSEIDGQEIRYAYVKMMSERLGKKAMERLNGAILGGGPVFVREFAYRAANNERRTISWRLNAYAHTERRCNDRRKKRFLEAIGAEQQVVYSPLLSALR